MDIFMDFVKLIISASLTSWFMSIFIKLLNFDGTRL